MAHQPRQPFQRTIQLIAKQVMPSQAGRQRTRLATQTANPPSGQRVSVAVDRVVVAAAANRVVNTRVLMSTTKVTTLTMPMTVT
jgi:hypothetical protein